MTTSSPTIKISVETYDMLQQIKKIFVSYTGEDIDNFSDDKIIEILASGFLGSEDDNEGWCGDDCGCHHDHEGHSHKDDHHHDKKDECCGWHCKC